MNLKDYLIYIGSISLGKMYFPNAAVKFFYLRILLPSLSFYLRQRHDNFIAIIPRNSIYEEGEFNFFLSDIDTTLVLKNTSDGIKITRDFLRLKTIFIMLDYPEIYNENEYRELLKIKEDRSWKVVDLFWNIRKINWCKKALSLKPHVLNTLKMRRSMIKSFKKILKKEFSLTLLDQRCFYLKDLKYISLLIDSTCKDIVISSYSDFLANDNSQGIYFELSRDQFTLFNSLFPGDMLSSTNHFNENSFAIECKKNLENHERLITLSSIRLRKAQSLSVEKHIDWLKKLEKKEC